MDLFFRLPSVSNEKATVCQFKRIAKQNIVMYPSPSDDKSTIEKGSNGKATARSFELTAKPSGGMYQNSSDDKPYHVIGATQTVGACVPHSQIKIHPNRFAVWIFCFCYICPVLGAKALPKIQVMKKLNRNCNRNKDCMKKQQFAILNS